MLYHKENPADALTKLLAYQILGLFDQPPIPDSIETLTKIKAELMLDKDEIKIHDQTLDLIPKKIICKIEDKR